MDAKKIRFLVLLGGGTEAEADPKHPNHYYRIKQALDNALLILETAQEYYWEVDNNRFNEIWQNLNI